MSQFIVTIPDNDSIPSFLDSLAESDEYSEFIDNHRGVLIGFLEQVFDQLAFSGQEVFPSEESQQCPDYDKINQQLAEIADEFNEQTDITTFPLCSKPAHYRSSDAVEYYRAQYGNTVADAYDTERALERIQS